jgi:hypothetical protein
MRAAVVFVLALVGVSSPVQAAGTPFALGDQGGVIVPVTLNGRGPFKLLLDTGSTHSAVVGSRRSGHRGAGSVAKTMMGSATGGREVIVVRIDALECGALGRARAAGIRPCRSIG